VAIRQNNDPDVCHVDKNVFKNSETTKRLWDGVCTKMTFNLQTGFHRREKILKKIKKSKVELRPGATYQAASS
jgi:hypothetical protein